MSTAGSIVFHRVNMALENFTCFKFSPLDCPQPVMGSRNFFIHGSLTGEQRVSTLLCTWYCFVLNVNKCCLEPSQTGKWLSFIVDLLEGKFHVPACKLDKLKAFVESIYSFPEFQCAF